jgi:hypothetical protein
MAIRMTQPLISSVIQRFMIYPVGKRKKAMPRIK